MTERERRLDMIRNEALEDIKLYLRVNGLDELCTYDIWDGSAPIILEDIYEENNTYTLDKVYVTKNRVYFVGENACRSFTWEEDEIPTDALLNIADWLEDNFEEIREYSNSL